ncbi:MAG: 2-hydroxyacyl-CoA dehydratase [Spirochaetales bacterium]|nr:2-hydroxyacyl-CoA dehydratase [Spirochaetales bacterium]
MVNMKKNRLNSLKSNYNLNILLNDYYKEMEMAGKNKKLTAAVNLGFPVDLLHAYDIFSFFPQSHSAMYASLRKSREEIEFAESKGIPFDLCSEIKIALSSLYYNRNYIVPLIKPDMVLCSNQVCRAVIKLFEQFSHYYKVPFFMLDIPFVPGEEVSEDSVRYIEKQLETFPDFLHKHFGLELHEDKLLETARLSQEVGMLWYEIVNFGATIPSPVDALDLFTHMFPYMNMKRSKAVFDHYTMLKNEIITRMEDDISAVEDEEIRLLWDYMPVFSKNNYFRRIFQKFNAAVVTNTFFLPGTSKECREGTCGMRSDINTAGGLFKYWAGQFSHLYSGVSINKKLTAISDLIEKYSIDGVIIHKDNSCKPQSLPQQELHNLIRGKLGVPCLTINADSADMRYFSQEQVTTRIEAFLENL